MIQLINSHTNKPYTPEMADHVCRYYSWVKVNKLPMSRRKVDGEKNLTNDPEITYLGHSILMAEFAFSGVGINYTFVAALEKEWDNVEQLFNDWPLHTIEYSVTQMVDGVTPYTYNNTVTVKKYGKVVSSAYIPVKAKLISHTIK